MNRAKGVIGANWGDEGKGLMTDYFSNENTTVVRFNGGAQAGHTVETTNNRHVFHHFGSGSFRKAKTYLSKYFISNPILFYTEYMALKSQAVTPIVAVDDYGLVSTHFDMMINQMIEEARGTARHGSCGLGINETIKRSEFRDFKITVNDLKVWSDFELISALVNIQNKWVTFRLRELNHKITDEWFNRVNDNNIIDFYVEKVKFFLTNTNSHITDNTEYVFEGAQGLLLDEDHYFFPHVTHSHTGIKNVVSFSEEHNIKKLDVTYVTRAYATRHGAGPFPGEEISLRYIDKTNVPNDWQGTLRFGYLNIDLLAETINNDIRHSMGVDTEFNIAITCMDQIEDRVKVILHNDIKEINKEDLPALVSRQVSVPVRYLSYGPTRESIRLI